LAVPNGIHPRLLKEVAEAISEALAVIFETHRDERERSQWSRDVRNIARLFKQERKKS